MIDSAPRSTHTYLALCLSLLTLLTGCGKENDAGYEASQRSPGVADVPFPVSHNLQRQLKIGPDACVECHEDAVEDWKKSHHAKANRPVSLEQDRAAFTPTRRIEESGVIYEMALEGEKFLLRVLDKETEQVTQTYDLVGVIAYTPLRQYLAMTPGKKFQTISASYDVINDEWFDVYQGQNRMPGEWGHWAGQGMNWNSNCAYCHTTEYSKGYDFESNSYHSTWVQQGIACAECHGNLEQHVKAAKAGRPEDGIVERLSEQAAMQNCATCHSRRDQLTPDAFEVGDEYFDHFNLALPSQPGLYYHDGQILDEVFVYGSFHMSRMHHKGVQCMDCHNPHTLENVLPVENNMLCMKCHESGADEAPIIIPTEHSFHAEGSTGNRCVECHMPKTKYMEIDPRADHGFHHPDPLMTQELGIPNACSKCHTEESLEWAVEWSEKWYGDKLASSPQRARARALAAAHAYEPEGLEQLLDLAKKEDIPAWIATYTALMANYLPNEEALAWITQMTEHETSIVRANAVNALAGVNEASPILKDRLSDQLGSVRIAAALGMESLGHEIDAPLASKEWEDYLQFNIDRPQSLMILAMRASKEGRPADLHKYVARAVLYDSKNSEIYRQCAILLSTAGLNSDAERYLKSGWALDGTNPMFPYSLGLLAAEENDLDTAVGYLEETVALAPDFYRAWYNLSLAYQKLQRMDDAERAMRKAQGQ